MVQMLHINFISIHLNGINSHCESLSFVIGQFGVSWTLSTGYNFGNWYITNSKEPTLTLVSTKLQSELVMWPKPVVWNGSSIGNKTFHSLAYTCNKDKMITYCETIKAQLLFLRSLQSSGRNKYVKQGAKIQ